MSQPVQQLDVLWGDAVVYLEPGLAYASVDTWNCSSSHLARALLAALDLPDLDFSLASTEQYASLGFLIAHSGLET
jgi:hypothetical protein